MPPHPGPVELVRHRTVGLEGLVAGVVGLREEAVGLVERRQPAGSLTLVRFSLGDRVAVSELSDGQGAGGTFGSFVSGFMPGYAVTQCAGQNCLQLYLTPSGVARILGVPAGELARRVVDLDEVAPQLGGPFLDQLASEDDWPARFALLDGRLRSMATRGRASDPVAEGVWRRIVAGAGAVRIGALAEESGWSHGRLTTRLREHVGVNPKAAAALVRFERALHELSHGPGLAELAHRRGYADQSHLTRDFAHRAGASPAALRRQPAPTAWSALGLAVPG